MWTPHLKKNCPWKHKKTALESSILMVVWIFELNWKLILETWLKRPLIQKNRSVTWRTDLYLGEWSTFCEKKIVFGRKDDFLEEWIRVWKNGSHFGRIDNIFLKWIRMYSRTNNFLENGSNFGRTDQYLEEGFFG